MEFTEALSFGTFSVVALVWLIDKAWKVEFAAFYEAYGATREAPNKMSFGGIPGISDLFWALLYGLVLFYIEFPLKEGLINESEIFSRSFLIGMAVYMLFDLTNSDAVHNWSFLLILIDIAWGGLLVAIFTTLLF